jgi:hypothetical protein
LFVFVPPFVLLLLLVLVFVITPLARSQDATRGPKPDTRPFAAAASEEASKQSSSGAVLFLGHLGSLCAQIKHVCILQKH